MRSIFSAISVLLAFAGCASNSVGSAFVPVFIDARAEAKLGPFPYDRSVYANAMIAFERLGAKGVVLKFFLDQPKGAGDATLAAAMTKLPVVLQARCDDAEQKPNLLDSRFSTVATAQMTYALACKAGWIPLPPLQKNAANVCFIDQPAPDLVPVQERYRDRAVKSLYLCAMVMAGKADQVAFRTGTLKVDVRKAPRVEVISLIDVLDGKIDRARMAGKVVVFGYEGPKSDMFDTPVGRLSAHRAFMTNLLAIEAGAFELK